MFGGVCPAEQISRQIECNNAAGASFVGPARSHSAADHQEHVVGRISLTHDYVVAVVSNWTAAKRTESAIY